MSICVVWWNRKLSHHARQNEKRFVGVTDVEMLLKCVLCLPCSRTFILSTISVSLAHISCLIVILIWFLSLSASVIISHSNGLNLPLKALYFPFQDDSICHLNSLKNILTFHVHSHSGLKLSTQVHIPAFTLSHSDSDWDKHKANQTLLTVTFLLTISLKHHRQPAYNSSEPCYAPIFCKLKLRSGAERRGRAGPQWASEHTAVPLLCR